MKLPFLKKEKGKMLPKVAIGLSGGVDSAVSAYLLKKQGYDVTGVYLQCWGEMGGGCSADKDRIDAVKISSRLGIKFKYLNFVKEYKKRVIDVFYDEYKKGRTPNPDVLCNREIKFGLFLDWAMKKKFDFIATGHYAKTVEAKQRRQLLKGVDDSKDQSYFLYLLTQEQLSKVIFPLGDMKKKEVRKLAKEIGLHNFDKPDSVGICFVGEVDIFDFLKKELEVKPGNVVNKDGEVIGTHNGVWFYTIGQRKGFKVEKYYGIPLYVIGKNVEKNELIVGFRKEVLKKEFDVEELHWIGEVPKKKFDCKVRIRHLGEMYKANVILNNDAASVKLKDSAFGVAPGQCAVFYDGDVVLGGGVIV